MQFDTHLLGNTLLMTGMIDDHGRRLYDDTRVGIWSNALVRDYGWEGWGHVRGIQRTIWDASCLGSLVPLI
jgi:hypothetical protein